MSFFYTFEVVMFKESEFYKNINETAKEAALGGHTDLTLALVNLGEPRG